MFGITMAMKEMEKLEKNSKAQFSSGREFYSAGHFQIERTDSVGRDNGDIASCIDDQAERNA